MDTIVTHICNIQQYQGVNQVITWYHISILVSFCLLWVTRFPNHRNIPLSKLLPVSHCSFELHHLSSIIFQNRSIQQSFIDPQLFIIAFINQSSKSQSNLSNIENEITNLSVSPINHQSIIIISHQNRTSSIINQTSLTHPGTIVINPTESIINQSIVIIKSSKSQSTSISSINQSSKYLSSLIKIIINYHSINNHHQSSISSQSNHHQNQTIINSTIKSNQSSSKNHQITSTHRSTKQIKCQSNQSSIIHHYH